MKPFFVVACLFWAAGVSAQTVFVQGGGGREVKRFSGEPDTPVFDATTSAWTAAVAGFVAPRWTVGLELDIGGRSTVSHSETVTISGRPTTVTTDFTTRRKGLSALVGYHTAGPRVRVGYYAGLSFSTVRREIGSNAPAVVLTEPPQISIFTDRVAGAIVGIDGAIALTPHVAIVPSLRAQALALSGDLAGHSVRPSLCARITF
jgi:hypothetical protein